MTIHALISECSKRKLKYAYKPCIDSQLLYLIRENNLLYRKKKKCPSEYNKIQFSKLRSKVNHETRKKKKLYYDKYFKEHKNNSKKTWEGLYSAMEKTKTKKSLNLNIVDKSSGVLFNDAE